jgi:DNA polymerase-3 subunit epsilon
MKILFFDLETTGVFPGKHGIHQISGEIVIYGETKEQFNFKVRPNPKAVIEQEALEVAGVTREQILAYPPMEEVYSKFVSMLGKYVDKFNKTDKFFLAGYNNASFDNQFLRGFFMQNGDNYFGSWFWSNSLDVMVLATYYLLDRRSKMENFRLATVAREMGIDIENEKLHDAFYDLYLTKSIYDKVTKCK